MNKSPRLVPGKGIVVNPAESFFEKPFNYGGMVGGYGHYTL